MSKGPICFVTLASCVAAASAEAPRFTSVQPELFSAPQALSNAIADVDGDGDLDLSLTDDFPENATRNGSEVRLYSADGKLLGTRLVSTGDGYGSQSVVPVHFGLATTDPVTVEVTFLTREGRKRKRLEGVDPRAWTGKALVVKAD